VNVRIFLGLLLLGAIIVLAILFAVRIQPFDTTIADMLAAIGAFIGAKEVFSGTTYYTTPNK
jgi:hypothetical protein